MENLAIIVLAIVGIVVLAALAIRLRRTPVVGEGELAPRGTRAVRTERLPDALRVRFSATREPIPAEPGTDEPRRTLHFKKTVVARRIVLKVGADRTSISVDDQSYESLDQILDDAVRAEVRAQLGSMPAQVHDPAARLKVEASLRSLGIEPTAD
jgi:hypothetical protein